MKANSEGGVRGYANPSNGVYYCPKWNKIFILSRKDGPYPLVTKDQRPSKRDFVSLYVFENEDGRRPKTVIAKPFNSVRIGAL